MTHYRVDPFPVLHGSLTHGGQLEGWILGWHNNKIRLRKVIFFKKSLAYQQHKPVKAIISNNKESSLDPHPIAAQ